MAFLEMFGVRPHELDQFTCAQIRQLADRTDTLITEANRAAAQARAAQNQKG
jgi:hypothetical protein